MIGAAFDAASGLWSVASTSVRALMMPFHDPRPLIEALFLIEDNAGGLRVAATADRRCFLCLLYADEQMSPLSFVCVLERKKERNPLQKGDS